MKQLSKEEIVGMINNILDVQNHTESEINHLIQELKASVTDPKITNYIFYDELTPEEIADKALAYKPICL